MLFFPIIFFFAEYANKSELPPPFNIIQLIYYVIKAIVKREMPRWKFIKRELKVKHGHILNTEISFKKPMYSEALALTLKI